MLVDNAKDPIERCIDVLMPFYNLLKYSKNYSEMIGNLLQCYRDEKATTDSFKFKAKVAGKANAAENKDVEIVVP